MGMGHGRRLARARVWRWGAAIHESGSAGWPEVGPARRSGLTTVLIAVAMVLSFAVAAGPAGAASSSEGKVVMLTSDDFRYGTYIIDQPGTYRLAEDVAFNPNSPATLTAAVADGTIPGWLAGALELPTPVDAYHAGFPLFTQFAPGGVDDFSVGGPLDPRYDPAAYGIGFFAAISITADDVVLDLNGHTIEQSAEHALLQRFFAVIELADQPFVPAQGPFDFGTGIDSARRVTIKNGTIGLSSHHGIHGNGNVDVAITNVDFAGYEVGAVALNGVKGLKVTNVTAVNRKDVPVLGTFSSAQFIKAFVEDLARAGSTTTLTVDGQVLDVNDIKQGLIGAINATHGDLIATPNVVDGRAQIDPATHPDEYALFHNQHGVVDGNSYSFLVNSLGVAVNGFPLKPDGVTKLPSENVSFTNVRVIDQVAAINEVPAIDVGGAAAIDPIGAVFQIRNLNPATNAPVTISANDDSARYTGNVVANAQAFVARANLNGEFASSVLNVSRLNITEDILAWVEGEAGSTTLAESGISYLCNGDSMFHVNKGVIAFKMDAARNVRLTKTSVSGLENLGAEGSTLCGDYLEGKSHPAATLLGYGGSMVRGYTFSGTEDAVVFGASARGLSSRSGSAIGFDILTDSSDIRLSGVNVSDVNAGWYGPIADGSPTKESKAYGFYVGADAGAVTIVRGCATQLVGQYGFIAIDDHSGTAQIVGRCGRR